MTFCISTGMNVSLCIVVELSASVWYVCSFVCVDVLYLWTCLINALVMFWSPRNNNHWLLFHSGLLNYVNIVLFTVTVTKKNAETVFQHVLVKHVIATELNPTGFQKWTGNTGCPRAATLTCTLRPAGGTALWASCWSGWCNLCCRCSQCYASWSPLPCILPVRTHNTPQLSVGTTRKFQF